ncbi:hypothetical protein SD074_17090 [Prolixibacter sp. SD074]|nr:hypothetical protein SD074_17090 [Prolixibacter sp. SD074]
MEKFVVYMLAFMACFIELVIYSIIGVWLGWKNGGGIFTLALLLALMTFTWKKIINTGNSRKTNEIKQKNDN